MKLIKIGKNTYEKTIRCALEQSELVCQCIEEAEYSKRNYWAAVKTVADAHQVLALVSHCKIELLVTSGNGRVFKTMNDQAVAFIKNASLEDRGLRDKPEEGDKPEVIEHVEEDDLKALAQGDHPYQPPGYYPENLYEYKKLRLDVLDRTEQLRACFNQLFADQTREITSLRRYLARVIGSASEIPEEYLDGIKKHHPEVIQLMLEKSIK